MLRELKRVIIGEPLSTHRLSEEKIPKWKALAVLSSDALSSTAYATEEILIPLAIVSTAALAYSVPIAGAIVILLVIVSLSYWQLIQQYRNGGGAYIVAKDNLGQMPGLIAAASLMIDYVLTVAVSVAAGITAVTSAFPELFPYRVSLGIITIVLLTILNLRGIRESSTVFAFPTYAFIALFYLMLGVGAWRVFHGDFVPAAPIIHDEYPAIALFMVLRAFSSGCAALTGIEAISNGVPVFRPPAHRNAKLTLAIMAVILSTLFFGVTALSHWYGIVPHEGEAAVSQLARSIFGNGVIYYLIQASTALILFLAANTSYNGFPWLTAVLAKDRYVPRQFAGLGDRLVFSRSIIGLSVGAICLLVAFDARTHALIPLYAIGVFLGFTLAQAGMVKFHLKHKERGWRQALSINAFGAATTAIVMVVIASSKFMEGAWLILLLIPSVVFIFTRVHNHYVQVGKELSLIGKQAPEHLVPYRHTVIVPISGVHIGVVHALKYALSISDDVRAIYVDIDSEAAERMRKEWTKWGHDVPLVVLKSPYRSVIRPLLDYMDDLEQTTPRDLLTIVIPEFITKKWWHQVLHNQTALLIRAALLYRPGRVITSVRYHLRST